MIERSLRPTELASGLLIVLLALLPGTARAQTRAGAVDTSRPTQCEHVTLYRELVGGEVMKQSNKCLILIARLGDGERSSKLNLGRLDLIERALREDFGICVVAGQGERRRGLGCVDMYVDGELAYQILYPRNQRRCDRR